MRVIESARRRPIERHGLGANLSIADYLALLVLVAGVVACLVVWLSPSWLGAESFAYPKEAVVTVAGLLALACRVAGRRPLTPSITDACLLLFFGICIASFLLAGARAYAEVRALSLMSGLVAVLLATRALATDRHRETLLLALVLSVAIVSFLAILEAHDRITSLSTLGRAPGATLGNRNRLAHVCAITLPVISHVFVVRRSRAIGALVMLAWMAVVATLTLTRSRAGWLAAVVALTTYLGLMAVRARAREAVGRSEPPSGARRPMARMGVLGAAAVVGILLAVLPPNDLQWASDAPYRDTLGRMGEHREGSGRGRLVQWRTSMLIAASHPWVGVGPGRWTVAYRDFALADDPTVSRRAANPVNRLPSGEWTGIAAQCGVVALSILLCAWLASVWSAMRVAIGPTTVARRSSASALVAAAVATAVVGCFDPVLGTPAVGMAACIALGALRQPEVRMCVQIRGRTRAALALLLLLGLAVAGTAAISRLRVAMLASSIEDASSVAELAKIDPPEPAIQFKLAEIAADAGDCEAARRHALHAMRLNGASMPARQLAHHCSERLP